MIRAFAGASYLFFLGTLAYVIGWLAGSSVVKGIDDGHFGSTVAAVAVDLALLAVFAVQHSVMARPWFKRRWTKLVPVAAERAMYVLISSAVVALLVWQWRPLTSDVWHVSGQPWRVLVWIAYGVGWLIVLASTMMIGQLEFFGLAQALHGDRFKEREFGRPGFYAFVRHPIMTGFVIVFWATPDMTAGHALFAAASSAYIAVAVRFEEHDLRARIGAAYDRYAVEVPRFAPALRRPRWGARGDSRLSWGFDARARAGRRG